MNVDVAAVLNTNFKQLHFTHTHRQTDILAALSSAKPFDKQIHRVWLDSKFHDTNTCMRKADDY